MMAERFFLWGCLERDGVKNCGQCRHFYALLALHIAYPTDIKNALQQMKFCCKALPYKSEMLTDELMSSCSSGILRCFWSFPTCLLPYPWLR